MRHTTDVVRFNETHMTDVVNGSSELYRTLKSCPSISFPSRFCSSFSKGLSLLGSMPYSVGAPLIEVSTLDKETTISFYPYTR